MSKAESMTTEEVIKLVETMKEMFPYNETYWRLRTYRVKYIRETTVEVVRCCLAIQSLGIPINTRTIAYMLKKSDSSIVDMMHRLGDLNILVLKRRGHAKNPKTQFMRHVRLVWIVHPNFMKVPDLRGKIQ